MMKIISNKLLFVNDNFYIKGDSHFKKVEGKKLSLSDYPNVDLFLYKNKIGFWCVIEGMTGRRLTKFHKDLPKVMREIKKTLQLKSESMVLNKIFVALKTCSLSPRYNYIANPTRKRCGVL